VRHLSCDVTTYAKPFLDDAHAYVLHKYRDNPMIYEPWYMREVLTEAVVQMMRSEVCLNGYLIERKERAAHV